MRIERIGSYDVTALIGEGGMGQVYQASDTWLDRTVAIRGRARDTVQAVCCGLVAAALVTGTVRAQQSPGGAAASVQRQTVGVMPFANLSRAEADQVIGDGIAETLAADLVATTGIEVVHCGPVSRAARAGTSLGVNVLEEVAALRKCRERGATWLIAGGYQRTGDRLRITARLLEVATGGVRHTVRVEGVVDELFVLQDHVVEAVGAQVGPSGRATVPDTTGEVSVLVDQPDRLPVPPTPVAPTPATAVATPAVAEETALLVFEGPPPPLLPETIARDAAGRVTVRAVRVSEPLRIDGALDERVYRDVSPASGFIQREPLENVPATELTDVWVFFDGDHVYISARCWDSAPESRWVANDMRRDGTNVGQGDVVVFLLDTFYDRRNGVVLTINPIGGRLDGQMTDERNYNGDWNPIWDLSVGRFEGGWTVETAIPFKSLRYRPGRAQVWGFNAQRNVRWKNENSTLRFVPAARGLGALMQASLAATLVGLEAPGDSRSLEIKPYAIADLTSDPVRDLSNDPGGDIGVDVKYGVTQNLVADVTINTDFAQVEADEQQVNLTRFSLFFPEKREFFLENQGLFDFGGARSVPRGGGGGGNVPIMFYSRQIGLTQGQEVPIDVGGRLTGRVGKFSLGLLNIQTGDAPEAGAMATSFSVVRLRRDLLRRSSIGALFTGRSVSTVGTGSNEAYGLDGVFAFYDNLNINTYWAKTTTPGLREDDLSYRGQLDYNGDRYGVQLERLVVGDNFNPEVGFLRRDDFERSAGAFRFSPRPRSIALIRKLSWEGRLDYVTDRTGVLETRDAQGQFGIEFENGDQFNTAYTRSYEFLERPFPIAPGVTIPIGGYRFRFVTVSLALGPQRRLSGNVFVQHGGFFSGDRTSASYRGRLELTPQLSFEPSLSFNRVALPEGRFTTHLVTTRTTYTVTPLMFMSALVQYNSSNDSLSTNLRLRWEYSPGSELFVVYNEDRDTDPLLPDRTTELRNRAFVVKVNRLFRF